RCISYGTFNLYSIDKKMIQHIERGIWMSDSANSWDLPGKQKALMITALLTGAFMGIINEPLLATALPSIQHYFSISQGDVQWMTTAFMMTNGVMIPVSAFLFDGFTTRGLFLSEMGLLVVGTSIGAVSP